LGEDGGEDWDWRRGDYASMLGHARRSKRRGFEGWRVNFSKAATMAWAARDLVGA
jgi:hypothetical protein